MKTIEKIVIENWYDVFDLLKAQWKECNWCWWQWWFSFTNMFNKIINLRNKYKLLQKIILPTYNKDKLVILNSDLSLICCMHDKEYNKKKWFIKSNYKLAKNICKLFHWTTYRYILAVCTFLWTTIFWYKYYNK